ncbi:hypothetical protein [Mesorhizobium sp. M0678]|uniref:hypothetical protein n=1 Tax=Mesorhizobium sp. M0678 TaxID=2956985 RepID=UPI003339F38D
MDMVDTTTWILFLIGVAIRAAIFSAELYVLPEWLIHVLEEILSFVETMHTIAEILAHAAK